jgi:hypothetical protein
VGGFDVALAPTTCPIALISLAMLLPPKEPRSCGSPLSHKVALCCRTSPTYRELAPTNDPPWLTATAEPRSYPASVGYVTPCPPGGQAAGTLPWPPEAVPTIIPTLLMSAFVGEVKPGEIESRAIMLYGPNPAMAVWLAQAKVGSRAHRRTLICSPSTIRRARQLARCFL